MSDFEATEQAAVYRAIAKRRDVRQFRSGEITDETLQRVLGAAHHAPSVGYSQPWDFVVVRDRERRDRIRKSFLRCREREAARYSRERREKYLSYRLEGILDSTLNVCVTVDERPGDEPILGTVTQPESVRSSVFCAVQNLWLAARVEGLGVGWVSIVETDVLRSELALPDGVSPMAYLCVGWPVEFRDRPMLEETGWRTRCSLESTIHHEKF